jgi:cobalt-zinc-cadmium efflux system membrane fusion protein
MAPGDSGDRLAHIEIRAPFAGTIEKRTFAAYERITIGDPLFVLADSSRLWVAADVREQEWGVLGLAPESVLKVTVPALPGECFEATLHFVGREVSPQTNALPLMARIDNSSGQLRPGLFVRVELPFGIPSNVTAVPEAAVMEHEGQKFVFVDEGEGRFRRVQIEPGEVSDGWIEARSGVDAGANVVAQGAFVLKSELLLEREGD